MEPIRHARRITAQLNFGNWNIVTDSASFTVKGSYTIDDMLSAKGAKPTVEPLMPRRMILTNPDSQSLARILSLLVLSINPRGNAPARKDRVTVEAKDFTEILLGGAYKLFTRNSLTSVDYRQVELIDQGGEKSTTLEESIIIHRPDCTAKVPTPLWKEVVRQLASQALGAYARYLPQDYLAALNATKATQKPTAELLAAAQRACEGDTPKVS